ncbi:MAG: hypothetical protein EAZ51_01015 [Sphingobacteriales bacterium]|nr:MAG: hypothetical protein EAZ64_01545 [Sphingobacteriales bacterium]TAF83133.1 MAG: hypothetical protein EAZ51_01015 [Sphingobacteriales bacterium]
MLKGLFLCSCVFAFCKSKLLCFGFKFSNVKNLALVLYPNSIHSKIVNYSSGNKLFIKVFDFTNIPFTYQLLHLS